MVLRTVNEVYFLQSFETYYGFEIYRNKFEHLAEYQETNMNHPEWYYSIDFSEGKRIVFSPISTQMPNLKSLKVFPMIPDRGQPILSSIREIRNHVFWPQLISVDLPLTYESIILINNHIENLEEISIEYKRYKGVGDSYIDFKRAKKLKKLTYGQKLSLNMIKIIAENCPIENFDLYYDEQIDLVKSILIPFAKTLKSFIHNPPHYLTREIMDFFASGTLKNLRRYNNSILDENGQFIVFDGFSSIIRERDLAYFFMKNPKLKGIALNVKDERNLLEKIIDSKVNIEVIDGFSSQSYDFNTDLWKSPRLSSLKRMNRFRFENNQCIESVFEINFLWSYPEEERYFIRMNPLMKIIHIDDYLDYHHIFDLLMESKVKPEEIYYCKELYLCKKMVDYMKNDTFSRLKRINYCFIESSEFIEVRWCDFTLESFRYFLEKNKKIEILEGIYFDDCKDIKLIHSILDEKEIEMLKSMRKNSGALEAFAGKRTN